MLRVAVVAPPENVHRHFIPWGRPLLPQAAAWLAGEWTGPGALDLSAVLVIVPTRQSGRRLREALAGHAASRGAAVFPPRVHTPDTLLAGAAADPGVATRLESLLAWAGVAQAIDLAEWPEVFPVAPPRRDFAWAWRLAQTLAGLQTELAEGGLAIADVVAQAGADFVEAARWRQLAGLEYLHAAKLAAQGLCAPPAARRKLLPDPPLPPGVRRVVLLAVPDPLPLALEVLARWAEQLTVDVVVFAPPAEKEAFDGWGRPVPATWAARTLVLPDFERRVQLCADPGTAAEWVVAAAQRYVPPDGLIAVGSADPEVLPRLEVELGRAGLAGYNPEGRARRGESLHALLSALAALGREPSFDTVAALARCPDFLTALVARGGPGTSAARWLEALDDLRGRCLPPDLPAAFRHAREKKADRELHLGLELMAELHGILGHAPFPDCAVAALGLIFGGRRFDLARADDARTVDAAEAWRGFAREVGLAAGKFGGLTPDEGWQLALGLFAESRRTEEKPAGALDLQGWLELLWEDAPHLVVAGVNNGFLPEAVVGDAFLPETLREKLALKTNAARLARDAYLLQAIAAWRNAGAGRLDLLVAKTSTAGEPLRPSRLLLRCPDAELPARVDFLFRPIAATRLNLPWKRAWRLAPRRAPLPTRVPVTGLRTWLACPFRFYLAQVLRMEPVDAEKTELDARDFGIVCHAALEAMALEPALRDCQDERVLRDFLLAELDRTIRVRFGEQLTLPLVIQLESARQRLAKAAEVQARERAEGWVIDRVEWKFAIDLGGLEIRGKIDRIDRHETTGAWRVLDYKTTDTATPPARAHLRLARSADAALPAWRRVRWGKAEYTWTDLQLPLYLRALEAEAPEVAAGYFNLPKAVGETALSLWSDLTPEVLAAARGCAEGVAAAIRAGEFWPPAELPDDRDTFAALFHHGAGDSIAWLDEGAPPVLANAPGPEARPNP